MFWRASIRGIFQVITYGKLRNRLPARIVATAASQTFEATHLTFAALVEPNLKRSAVLGFSYLVAGDILALPLKEHFL
jgi:hypothetical protein